MIVYLYFKDKKIVKIVKKNRVPVKCETKSKRNEINRNSPKRNEINRNEIDRNETE